MSSRRAVYEVARREIVERCRSRVLRVSVVLLLLASVGGAIAAARLSGGAPTDDIGLVGARSAALAPAIRLEAQAAGRRVHLANLGTQAAAARAVRDGTVAVALVDGTRLLVKTSRTQAPVRVVQDAVAANGLLTRLESSGLTQSQALRALTPAPLPIDVLEPAARNLERNRGLIVIGLLALFMVLVFYGQAVAQGVTEEKSSRVVELLLTTVSPRRLLAGKVVGIGVLGLAQLLLAGGAALIAGKLAGGAGLPSAAPKAVALVVLWFVLGYAFYSVAFAVAGALVSRQEDLTTAMLPINLLLIGAFYLALIVVNVNPDGTLAQIAAFVPPLSPMVVPARMVLGDMNAVGLTAAVAIDLVATAGLMVLAGRMYERAILRIGAPVRVRQVLRRRPARAGLTDAAGRAVAVVALLAGVAIGLEHVAAIALTGFGLLLVVLLEVRRHRGGERPSRQAREQPPAPGAREDQREPGPDVGRVASVPEDPRHDRLAERVRRERRKNRDRGDPGADLAGARQGGRRDRRGL
jgi:ABC-2 type transport system permease protein